MSSLGGRRAIMIALILSTCGAGAPGAYAQSWAEHWFDNVTYTSPGSFEDQARGYVTAGGFSGRVDVHNDYLMSVTLPKVRAGCGGIDMFLGGMSFLDPDYLVQKLENVRARRFISCAVSRKSEKSTAKYVAQRATGIDGGSRIL